MNNPLPAQPHLISTIRQIGIPGRRPRSKTIQGCFLAILMGAMSVVAVSRLNATTLTWDSSGNVIDVNPTDGSGTWKTTGTNWDNGGTDFGWPTGGDAVIGNGGTAGTITVSGGVSVNSITFNPVTSGSYTVQSSTIALTGSNITVNAAGATITSVLTGSVGLVKSGTGALTLGALNTYSGGTVVNAGTLILPNEGAGGQADIVGALTINSGATVAADTHWVFGFNAGAGGSVTSIAINSGTLNFNAGGADVDGFSPASITMTGGSIIGFQPQWYGANSSTPSVNTNASAVTSVISTGFDVRTDSISGLIFNVASGTTSSGVDLLISGGIVPATGSAFSITKNGAGLMALSGAVNNNSGAVKVNAGTLQLGNGGSTGSIPSGSAVSGSSGGTLAFNETGSQTFSNTISGGMGVTQQGGGGSTVILTGPNTYTGPTVINSGTLQIGSGATAGAISSSSAVSGSSGAMLAFGQIGALSVGSAISGALGVAQLVSGTTTLGGNSSYTGPTSITAGVLRITGTLGNTSITVSSGASLAGTGLIGGAVTVNGGGAITLVDGVIGTLTLSNGVTIGSNTTVSVLDFEGSGSSWDLINDSASALNISGSTTINLTAIAGVTPGTYNLITFNSLTGSLGSVTLATSTLSGKSVSLLSTGTSEELVVAGLGVYWKGGNGTSWGASGPGNWTSDAAGTSGTSLATSSPTLDVYYNANGLAGPVTSSLGANYDVNGLFFLSSATGGVTISDGTSGLTLEGDGITVNPGTGPAVIGVTSVTVKTSQPWVNNSSSLLTVSSPVAGAAASGTTTLTMGGSGAGGALLSGTIGDGTAGGKLALVVNGSAQAVTLAANNTYSGGTTITSGTLAVGNGGTAGTLGSGAVTDNATLVFNRSDSPVISNAITDTGSLVNVGTGTLTLSGVIGSSGSLTQAGSGTLTLTNANTYTGATTVSSGILLLQSSSPQVLADASAIVITGGTMELNDSAINVIHANADTVGAGGTMLNIGEAATLGNTGVPVTLTGGVLTGSNNDASYGSYYFNGPVNVSGGTPSTISAYSFDPNNSTFTVANGSTLLVSSQMLGGGVGFTKAGTGTMVLTGSSIYTAGTVISSGTLQLGNGGTTGSISTSSAVTGATGGTLAFDRSNALAFPNTLSTGLGVTQAGTGTTTLSANNSYTGPTSVTAGVLSITGTLANTTLTVSNGGALAGTGLIGGAVTVNGGGAINLVDGTIGKLTLSNGLTIGSNTTASILDFEGNAIGFDLLKDTAALSVSGTTTINITALANLTNGTYNLITFGSTSGNLANLVLGTPTAFGKNLSLVTTSTSEELQVSSSVTAYWNGANGNSWSAAGPTNWTSDITGTTSTTTPISSTDVYFSANGVSSPVTTSLGANFDIGSLNFNSNATGSVAITDGTYGLTLEGAITIGAGTATHSINVKSVTVNANQAWINNSSNLFTVTSPVNGAAATSATTTLTFAGSGAGGMLVSGAIGSGTNGGQLAVAVNASGEQVTLTGSNTYGGGTTITAGTLQLGNGVSNNGYVAGNITDNAALVFANPFSQTYTGVVSGNGTLTKSGSGTLILTTPNTYTGATTVSSGILLLQGANSPVVADASPIVITGGTMELNGSGNNIIHANADTIGAGGTMLNIGSAVTLGNTGVPVTLTGGILSGSNSDTTYGSYYLLGAVNVSGSTTSTIGAYSFNPNGETFTVANGSTLIVSSQMISSGFTKAGTGTMVLTGSSTYSAGTALNAGQIDINNGHAFGASTSTFVINSGTIDNTTGSSVTTANYAQNWNGPFTFAGSNALNLGSGAVAMSGSNVTVAVNGANTLTVGGVISGSSSLTVAGAGTLSLGGNNTYTGATNVTGGTLSLTGIIGSGGGSAITNSATFTESAAGVITGSSSVTNSAGTTTLAGANTYTGPSNVNGGTLIVAGSLSGSPVNVAGGTLAGAGEITGNVIVGTGSGAASSSIIAPSAGGGTAAGSQIYVAGNLTLKSDAVFQFKLDSANPGATDSLLVSGTLALSGPTALAGFDISNDQLALGTQYAIAYANSLTGTFANLPEGAVFNIGSNWFSIDYDNTSYGGAADDIVLTAAIPEPGTWASILGGFAMLLAFRKRRQRLTAR